MTDIEYWENPQRRLHRVLSPFVYRLDLADALNPDQARIMYKLFSSLNKSLKISESFGCQVAGDCTLRTCSEYFEWLAQEEDEDGTN